MTAAVGEAVAETPGDYAILVSLATLEEAEVMASALRADGIDAFIGNRHHLNVDWGYTIALGGVQVMAPRARLQDAKDMIRARIKEAAADPDGEAIQRKDRYKLWLLLGGGFALWFVGVGMSTSLTIDRDLQMRSHQASLPDFELMTESLDETYCRQSPEAAIYSSSDGVWRETPCSEILAPAR